jgi:hypothetical protein
LTISACGYIRNWLRVHNGSFETGKIFSLPSWGGRYHAPSIPIDRHWESNRVPARLLIRFTVADVAAQLAVGKPAKITLVLSRFRDGLGE